MNAIKEYENNKWKSIGQKVGKPAKACEQYAKENFPGELFSRPTVTFFKLPIFTAIFRANAD
jgi:hypothetical protein